MNFRQVEAFRAVMLHGTVTQAATAMNISQPAVTRLIMDFESWLTISLFDRDRGRLKPTSEAHMLFKESDMAFSGLARLREAAMVLKKIDHGRIRMITETVYAEGLLPRYIAKYLQSHPNIHFELDIGPSTRVADWIAETWYDIGLVVLPVAQTNIVTYVFQRQQALCAVPRDHRFAKQSVVNLKEFADERFIAPVTNSPFRLRIDSAMKQVPVRPNIQIEVRSQRGICSFVEAGAGIALVEPCMAQEMIDSNVLFKPCAPSIFWDIAVIIPKARKISLACHDFLEFLLQ
ncbi:MAG: LysR family transcriptional regulator [Desulfotignum sp.]|nr:LysR family transcriptional regulator [Desulfotignum sp.]